VLLQPGERIERYIIEGSLGSGGMGEVYRARDARLQRSVALKILHRTPSDEPGTNPSAGAARMLREARAAAALEHPNVVHIYDVGEVETPKELQGTTYLAMELIKGTTLRSYVSDASVSMEERIRCLGDIGRALAAAHAAGLVHRDIKPENVMIRDDGVVKVLDFGIAKRTVNAPVDGTSSTEGYTVPTMTGQGVVVGTPVYMAPEQLRADALDGRADQFAWGVVAYELLTGTLPWSIDGGGIALVAQILSASPRPLSERPDVPAHVASVVMRALSKDRTARFASMDDLVTALEALDQTVRGRPLRSNPSISPPMTAIAPPTPQIQTSRSKHPPPRSRRVLAGIAGIALVVGGAFALRGLPRTAPNRSASAPVVAPAGQGCASNAECTRRLGAAAICHHDDGTCAALASPQCKVLASDLDLASDATVWIGSMFPLAGAAGKAHGQSNANAVELARRDFSDAMAAVVTQAHSGARPIALVSCDDSDDPHGVARHLVDDVRVPAVIGFALSTEVIDLAESIFLPRDVMMIAALNTSPLITTLPHPRTGPRLVWRTTNSTLAAVPAIDAFIERKLEPEARAKAGAARAAPFRVALLRMSNAGLLAFSDALFRDLRFNGKSALDNGTDFREFVCDEACVSAGGTASQAIVRDIKDFAPHVVVFAGGELVDRVLVPLEATWPVRDHRPTFVAMTVPTVQAFKWIGTNATLRRRFFAVTSVSNTLPNASFVMHYNATFPSPITRTISPNTSYDAFYLLAFATYATSDREITGTSLASAMSRLVPPGQSVEVGPSGIYKAFDALRGGGSIDLTGATGRLDFDLRTGEAPVDMSILCVDLDSSGAASDTIESGLVFHAAEGALDGAMRCP
jgi:serine/threonine protein kinase